MQSEEDGRSQDCHRPYRGFRHRGGGRGEAGIGNGKVLFVVGQASAVPRTVNQVARLRACLRLRPGAAPAVRAARGDIVAPELREHPFRVVVVQVRGRAGFRAVAVVVEAGRALRERAAVVVQIVAML